MWRKRCIVNVIHETQRVILKKVQKYIAFEGKVCNVKLPACNVKKMNVNLSRKYIMLDVPKWTTRRVKLNYRAIERRVFDYL